MDKQTDKIRRWDFNLQFDRSIFDRVALALEVRLHGGGGEGEGGGEREVNGPFRVAAGFWSGEKGEERTNGVKQKQ